VYLYRFRAPIDEVEAHEQKYYKLSEEIWGTKPYDELSKEEIADIKRRDEELAVSMEMDPYGMCALMEKIEQDSALHPKHLFKVGYFRSSYNDGGLDSVLQAAIGMSLDVIFDVDGASEDGFIQPDWRESLDRALYTKEKFQRYIQDTPYRSMFIAQNDCVANQVANTPEQAIGRAIQKLSEHREEPDTDMSWFSTGIGHCFFGAPMELVVAVPAKQYGQEGFFLVYRDPELHWYLKAVEIVIETIEWVLDQPEPSRFAFSWSA
jgi:hypothetical protein